MYYCIVSVILKQKLSVFGDVQKFRNFNKRPEYYIECLFMTYIINCATSIFYKVTQIKLNLNILEFMIKEQIPTYVIDRIFKKNNSQKIVNGR